MVDGEARPLRSYEVQICLRPIRKSLGFFDHYFLIIDNVEYHLGGNYPLGEEIPRGTTKNAFVSKNYHVCATCKNILLERMKTHKYRTSALFPIINCETLTVGLSVQFIVAAIGTIAVLASLILRKFTVALLIILLTLVIVLLISKYTLSRTTSNYCKHLQLSTAQ